MHCQRMTSHLYVTFVHDSVCRDFKSSAWYLLLDDPTISDTATRFFTFVLLISNLIPLSLYVSMRLTRTAQKLFMDLDQECVYVNEEEIRRTDGESGRYPLNVRTMDLNDELGQITHLFTDKTGTLTSNYMEFRKFSVNGESCVLAKRLSRMHLFLPMPIVAASRSCVWPWHDSNRHVASASHG
jgi:magnesium-transporting ATPase (P-type)